MKKIVCELCEGTEFTKENGMFVCKGCGTSYTVEEARGMMREVEGDAVSLTGSSPSVNPNQQQLDNILLLASSAYEADNEAETENYCNQAIVLDAMCYKAWMLKGKAVGWQSKIGNLRIEEAAHSFCKAIDFAPEDEREELKTQAVEEIKRLGLALISIRKDRFSNSPDKDELNGFTSDKKVLLDALMVLLSHGNAVGIPDGYLEEVACIMNQAAVTALNMVRAVWKKCDHPSKNDFDTYLGWIGNIELLLLEAIDTSDNDDEEDIVRWKNLKIVIEEPMNAKSYKREWISWKSEYDWFVEYTLSDEAKTLRRKRMLECDEAIKMLEDKKKAAEDAQRKAAEEAKEARIKAYWEAHKDEKDKLESEKKQLENKKKEIDTQIADLEKQIESAEAEEKEKVPSEAEEEKLYEQVRELNNRRSKLGLFAGKEKKQISEEIAALEGRISAIKTKIQEEKKAKSDEIEKKISPHKRKRDELSKESKAATKRISAIDAELNKDPGE